VFDTKKFGAYVAQMRKNTNMTQNQLAEKLSLTRQAISKYEVGDSFPDITILIKIAKVFDITLDELIGSGNPTKKEEKIFESILKLSSDGIDISHIASLIYRLDNEKESMLEKIIEGDADLSIIKTLLPYMEDMAQQLEAAVIAGVLPDDVLEVLGEYYVKEQMK